MERKKYHITHLGKELNTTHWYDLSTEECNSLRKEYYKKPVFDLVAKNFKSLFKGKNVVSNIIRYYVKDLMAKVKLYTAKWSIEEVLQSDDLIRYFYSRTLSNNKVYPRKHTTIRNFEIALRLSGGGVAMKPSNFPMKTVDHILKCYNTNDNYYDFSCGWGIRMLSSMKHKINYYGTDPNNILVERLNEIHEDYDAVNKVNTFVDIRCQGSEVFVPKWKGKMGLIFSSPPYYNLEDYKVGEQSTKGKTYEEWLDQYMYRTLKNCKDYLTDDGYLLINVKNFSKYKLYDDVLKLAESLELEYIGYEILKNITRPSSKVNLNTDEKIMILSKISF